MMRTTRGAAEQPQVHIGSIHRSLWRWSGAGTHRRSSNRYAPAMKRVSATLVVAGLVLSMGCTVVLRVEPIYSQKGVLNVVLTDRRGNAPPVDRITFFDHTGSALCSAAAPTTNTRIITYLQSGPVFDLSGCPTLPAGAPVQVSVRGPGVHGSAEFNAQ